MAKRELLEEKKDLSRDEVLSKIKRLDGYIRKTEARIKKHEKALVKLRTQMQKEIQKVFGSILKGKIYG